jgi:hypothetical protein
MEETSSKAADLLWVKLSEPSGSCIDLRRFSKAVPGSSFGRVAPRF